MKKCPTFGAFILLPKCEQCEYKQACISATLGNLVERGYLKERFDREQRELVYSLTEVGEKRAVQVGRCTKKN